MTNDYAVDPESPIARLAALAPKSPKTDATRSMDRGENVDPAPSEGVDFGPVDVEKYLSHYSVEFNEKPGDGKTFYRLSQCVFDAGHTRNEAAIVQDVSGKLTYQCFHNSCKSRTWADARREISGEDSLAQFCANYDPNYHRGGKKKPASSPMDTAKTDPDPEDPVLPPQLVDPSIFFDDKKIRSKYLVRYLARLLSPILWDGSEFYRYTEAGVWRTLHPDLIGQSASTALDKYATNGLIDASIKLMGKKVMISAEDFRHNSDYLNLRNGLVEISTGKLLPHDPDYHSRIQLDVEYDEDAEAPRWDRFLVEIFEDDPAKILALQSFFGYCLLPDCRYQRCMFMIGVGANGKSVACDTLVSILGPANVCSLPIQLMGQRFLIGELNNKLVNIATEMATNQPIDTANFKDAVAGGLLTADQKHGKPFKFYPIAKHIFSMNEVPKITDKSHGFQRRPMVLTFNQRFDPGTPQNDPLLLQKLIPERNGIFMWMLDGLKTVLETGGLYMPKVVVEDTEALIKSTNPVLQFVEDCLVLGDELKVKPPSMYSEYKEWCKEGGNRALSRNRFYAQILMHCPTVAMRQLGEDRARYYVGIGLRDAWS